MKQTKNWKNISNSTNDFGLTNSYRIQIMGTYYEALLMRSASVISFHLNWPGHHGKVECHEKKKLLIFKEGNDKQVVDSLSIETFERNE
jgi:hypothetical protein